MTRTLAVSTAMALSAILSSCHHAAAALPDALVLGRVDATVQLDAASTSLAADYQALSLALYPQIATGSGDIVFSPLALGTALGMMYAGATGATADEMARVLHLSHTPASLPPAHRTLMTVIATAVAADPALCVATATRLWVDEARRPQATFAATLADDFSAPLARLDFLHDADGSEATINAWAEQQTKGLITDLLPKGAVDANTATVQTAALYFRARWSTPFVRDGSATTPFYALDAAPQPTVMLRQTTQLRTVQAPSYTAAALPYSAGAAEILLVMPTGDFHAFEATLDANLLSSIDAALTDTYATLALPPIDVTLALPSLVDVLSAMGMTLACSDDATFEIVDVPVRVGAVVERAYLKLDENGTEAAAVAAVVGNIASSAEVQPGIPVPVTFDHPFIYLVRDAGTGTVLFMGRKASP